ncbi:SHOCT domain-containing protein [Streptomyces sp. NPDC096136]|uniref:SHOCT domain-containing protein n=1 Tax=Streptomyces sp. NPDC096136 TaxID=3366076 RepID=UPI00382C3320
MYWNGHMGPWGWFAMSLTTLVFWGLIVAAVVLVVRTSRGDAAPGRSVPAAGADPARGAEALLAERYARGEIDDEEYGRRLAVLRGNAAGPAPPRAGP